MPGTKKSTGRQKHGQGTETMAKVSENKNSSVLKRIKIQVFLKPFA